MKLTVHCLVRDEDQWIWYALNSILPFADKILIYDTGSIDKTLEIIERIQSPKIILTKKIASSRQDLVTYRQEQLANTSTEWFMLLDGDEIWPEVEIKKLLKAAEEAPKDIIALFNRTKNCVGDVYHYLSDDSGHYTIAGITGHLNTRLMRNVPGLKVEGEYPLEAYVMAEGPVQNQSDKIRFVDCWYLHTSFLKRSSVQKIKTSGSLGRHKVPEPGLRLRDELLPDVFFKNRPDDIPNPLYKRGWSYELVASVLSPIKTLKRRIK
jgi:glycosyltransferase involved in cell wall biosynthesis